MNERENVAVSIGRRIAMLRKKREISLSKLAELAGISKSTLSAIESGKINPTISTLWAIAKALNVPFSELLPDELLEVEESGVTVRLIERSTKPRIEVYKMVLSPMAMRKAEAHQSGVIEKILVVSGSMIVGPASSPKLLKAGDEFEFRADVPHIYLATDEGAVAIVTIRYPTDSKSDFVMTVDEFKSKLVEICRESLYGVSALKIEVYGDHNELKKILNSMSMRNLKVWSVERGNGATVYIFSRNLNLEIPDFSHEAVKILKLARKPKLSRDELKYLQDKVSDPSPLLSVLASETLLIHGSPEVPKIGLQDPKILRPGYARQILFVASAIRRFFGDDVKATIIGDDIQREMLKELLPNLKVKQNGELVVSFVPDFDRIYELRDNQILIVSGDFFSPYTNRLERIRNMMIHHARLMIETLVEITDLTNDERILVDLLSKNVPLIAYLAEIGDVEEAFCRAYELYSEVSKISVDISNPLVSYYLLQRLELSEMIKSLKTYPERFSSLAEDAGLSTLYHARILATHGASDMDAGIHLFVFKKEG